MGVHTVLRDCLYLNWALPRTALPPAPVPLRYESHRHAGEEWVFVSALLFRQEGLRSAALPGIRLSYPQCNVRSYVLDGEGVPAVWFWRLWVPAWVSPGARFVTRMPCRAAALRFPRPSRQLDADSWRWSVHSGERRLEVEARQGTPAPGAGPDLGAWERTTDYFRRRERGYVHNGGGLRRIDATQAATALWPMHAKLVEGSLLIDLLATAEPRWPRLHSAWLCPEMPFTFEWIAARESVLPRQVPAPG
jgi:uncharacterized protein YqjF (DUF2071 family)